MKCDDCLASNHSKFKLSHCLQPYIFNHEWISGSLSLCSGFRFRLITAKWFSTARDALWWIKNSGKRRSPWFPFLASSRDSHLSASQCRCRAACTWHAWMVLYPSRVSWNCLAFDSGAFSILLSNVFILKSRKPNSCQDLAAFYCNSQIIPALRSKLVALLDRTLIALFFYCEHARLKLRSRKLNQTLGIDQRRQNVSRS